MRVKSCLSLEQPRRSPFFGGLAGSRTGSRYLFQGFEEEPPELVHRCNAHSFVGRVRRFHVHPDGYHVHLRIHVTGDAAFQAGMHGQYVRLFLEEIRIDFLRQTQDLGVRVRLPARVASIDVHLGPGQIKDALQNGWWIRLAPNPQSFAECCSSSKPLRGR